MNNNKPITKPTPARQLAIRREDYTKRLDKQIESLTLNFANILKAAKVAETSYQNVSDNVQMENYTDNLISSGESLLVMIYELKQAIILNDFEGRRLETAAMRDKFYDAEKQSELQIYKLQREVDAALLELEDVYHSSIVEKPPLN